MNRKIIFRITIDLFMMIFLLLLMSYQVTGEKIYEWLGTGMGLLFITHIILNRLWYKNLFKGKCTNVLFDYFSIMAACAAGTNLFIKKLITKEKK